uniref:Uncharacterized protein n=1 Tax=Eptatretus burgeri TaxID=7764 RepID=A0A8C4WXQ1_EPTBU
SQALHMYQPFVPHLPTSPLQSTLMLLGTFLIIIQTDPVFLICFDCSCALLWLAGIITMVLLSHLTWYWEYVRHAQMCSECSGYHMGLGAFLLRRIIIDGEDRRFEKIRNKSFVFFIYWTLQAMWIMITIRHPNYVGEILMWTGLALPPSSMLIGVQHLSLLSPIAVWFLLRYVSGVNPMEQSATQRWGHNPAYQRYVADTPVLFF